MKRLETTFLFRFSIFSLVALGIAAGFLFVLRESGKTDLFAASITWDGGGDGVNWTDDANWVGDVEPGTGDIAVFDGTNTNNVTIDASISVQGIDINAGYTGTITQGAGNTVTVGTGDFDISAGTFTGSDATIDINGTYTVSGGTFNSTTGQLQVADDFTVSSGAFNPSTGTVVADGGGNRTWTAGGAETFYNFTINTVSGGDVDVGAETFTVLNDLSNISGNLDGGVYAVEGDFIQGVSGASGDAIIDFANDAAAQTFAINGGTTPYIRFDSAADANDSLAINASSTIPNLIITSGFSGTVPLSNPGDHTLTFISIDMDAGTLDASGDTKWFIRDFDKTAGTFTAPDVVEVDGGSNVTWTFDSTPTFNDFEIDKTSGSRLTVAAIIVAGDVTFTDGRFLSGTMDLRGNGTVASGFDTSGGIVDFGDDATAQTITVAGGDAPPIRFNSAADANDVISITAASYLDEIIATAGFVGAIPISNPSDFEITVDDWDQAAGTYDASAQSSWLFRDFNVTGGSFTAPTTVTTYGSGAEWLFNGSQTVENFIIDKVSGSDLDLPAGNPLIVTGLLSLTDGEVWVGEIDARANISQAVTFDGGDGTINFGDNGVAQTYTIAGGDAPQIRFDNAADANDSVVFSAAADVDEFIITAGFAGSIPISNSSDFAITVDDWDQAAGSYDASAQSSWSFRDFNITGGSFTAPDTVTKILSGADWVFNGSQTFENFVVDGNASTNFNLPVGTPMIVTGSLTLTDGRMQDGTAQAQGNVVVNSTFDGGDGVLEFTGSNTQSFTLTDAGDFNGDIRVDKSGGQVNLQSELVMDATNQDFVIEEGTFHLGGNNLTANGSSGTASVESGGVFSWQGGESLVFNGSDPSFAVGSSVRYTGDGDAGADTYTITDDFTDSFEGIIIDSTDGATDTFDLGAAVDLSGDFTLTAGTFETNGNQMNVAGDWANTGTFQAEANEVIFDGTSQSISGATTFNDFTKQVSSADTITFPSTLTQTISGTLTLEGASGELLSLVASTPASAALINPTGSVTVNFLDVTDNTNSSGTDIECYNGCVDSGGNSGWLFTPPVGTQVTLDVNNVAPQILAGTEKLCDNSGGIANSDAAITACSNLSAVDLTAGSTLSVSLFVKARDNNSSSDIAATGQEAAYYHSANASPATNACSSDNNNCYQVVDGIRAAIIDSTDAWLRYDIDLEYYADASAGAPSWIGYTKVEDSAGLTDDNAGGEYSNDINSLVAVTFPDIAYGSISLPFTSSAANNVEITHQNNGNVIVDIDVGLNSASLTCSGNGSIPVSNIKFDDSDLAFGSMSKTLTQSPTLTDMDLNIAQRTNDSAPQLGTDQELSYWGLEVLSDALGACSGTVNVTSYQGS